ncbi:hypothetical protein QBC38DRAFT_470957 [Podospora fimiseda]|uniref:N-acetyltransferase domain-containing protein n=1 Tax=Podospora fimiseda TaxID=252190 RepID=A0AAN7BV84_9PEZI|nr:hypothetical protein QBC38DRAFT_470957 [Podospora fimiseda]
MSRPPQQPSIRSFFQPRAQPTYAAPPPPPPPSSDSHPENAPPLPTTPNDTPNLTSPPAPPLAPPLPPAIAEPITIPITLPPTIPVLPPPPSLPSGASIVSIEEHHIPALRRINSLLLPVAYPDSFYSKILDPLVSGLFSRAILWQDTPLETPKVIGGLVCRLEPNFFLDAETGRSLPYRPPPKQDPITPFHSIYIQSLALLSPYRSLGLAAAALDHIIASATLLPQAGASIDARTIYAHVWSENEEGLKWYESRGFVRHNPEPLKGYYFKLRPDTAWIVKRDIYSPTAPPPSNHPVAPSRPPKSTMTAAINLPPPPMGSTASSSAPPAGGPPRRPPPQPSASSSTTSLSYQTAKPETEWNDLPAEMMSKSQTLAPPDAVSGPPSGASSRSSSTVRKKKERAYPSAAFGK